jgi:hypothetical protein
MLQENLAIMSSFLNPRVLEETPSPAY